VAGGEAAPNIAPTDDHGGLNAERLDFLDPLGDLPHDLRRNIFAGSAFAQRFTAQLEDDALIDWGWSFALHGRT
jgi:hypothetical protein